MPSFTQSLDQKRAAFVWEKVTAVSKGNNREAYKTSIQKCSARIMTNGLGQTMVYLQGSSSEGDKLLFQHLNEWLCHKERDLVWHRYDTNQPCSGDITERITQVSSVTYRQATQEALAVLTWFKRYVDALS